MKNLLTYSLLLMMFPLIGCSSGSTGPGRIELCSRYMRLMGTDHPLPMEMGNELSKTKIKPDEPLILDPGEYNYNGSKFYFYDRDRDIQLLIAQNVNEDPEGDRPTALCVGGQGIGVDMEPVTYEVPVISKMSVDANGKTLITTKIIGFDIRKREKDAPLQIFVTNGTSGVEGSLKDVYQDYETVEQGLYTYQGNIVNTRAKIDPVSKMLEAPLEAAGLELRTEVSYSFEPAAE